MQRLRKSQGAIGQLERDVVLTAQREQERIGQDLHDGLCQVLTGIKFQAGTLHQRLNAAASGHARAAADIEARLGDAIQQARGMARSLAPVELDLGELATALDKLAGFIGQSYGVRCVCDCAGVPEALDPELASHLYRIAREACMNAVKHARPRSVRIQLTVRPGRFSLKITNDGERFRKPAAGHEGMGIRLMNYRARSLAAVLSVRPGAKGGCVVWCRGCLPQKPPPGK